MKINSYLNDYSEETIKKFLLVSRKILNKAELLVEDGPFINIGTIWFNPVVEGIGYDPVIRKLDNLKILSILDERYAGSPVLDPISFKLKVDLSVLRDFIQELELQINGKTQEVTVGQIAWPEYYRWDESGLNFLVEDGKMLTFQSVDQGRRKVFNSLVKRKGNPVLVSTIGEESGVDKVRIVINQINQRIKRNGLSNYLKIEALGKNKAGIRGAYRIVPA